MKRYWKKAIEEYGDDLDKAQVYKEGYMAAYIDAVNYILSFPYEERSDAAGLLACRLIDEVED